MIWLTSRRLRAAVAMTAATLVALLGLTGPGVADDFSTGVAGCVTQSLEPERLPHPWAGRQTRSHRPGRHERRGAGQPRQRLTYQPSTRFWTLQWIETTIYTAFALGLAGSGFWLIRRRLS